MTMAEKKELLHLLGRYQLEDVLPANLAMELGEQPFDDGIYDLRDAVLTVHRALVLEVYGNNE